MVGLFEPVRPSAAKIFSESVAAGMSIILFSKILPPSTQFTIYFINDMDKLFDIFNSSKTPENLYDHLKVQQNKLII
jgi:cephalosporin-C deacetylase-like acetyl esterase